MQRRLAWPLCKDDTQICEEFHIFFRKRQPAFRLQFASSVFKNSALKYYLTCWIFGALLNFTPKESPSSGIPTAFCPVFSPFLPGTRTPSFFGKLPLCLYSYLCGLGEIDFTPNPGMGCDWLKSVNISLSHMMVGSRGGRAIKLVQEEWPWELSWECRATDTFSSWVCGVRMSGQKLLGQLEVSLQLWATLWALPQEESRNRCRSCEICSLHNFGALFRKMNNNYKYISTNANI